MAKTETVSIDEEKYDPTEIVEDFSGAILDAIDQALQEASYDKTETGKITQIVDANHHKYKVQIDDAEITVKDNREWGLYPIGTTVQVQRSRNSTNPDTSVIIRGSDKGQTITATFQDGEATGQHTIVETYPDGTTLTYYIDVNDDGECTALHLPNGTTINLANFNF